MSEFAPVTLVRDLHELDEQEMMAGYSAGWNGMAEPIATNFSRAFWHGWRNGASDAGHRARDGHQEVLAQNLSLARGCEDAFLGAIFTEQPFRCVLQ